MPFSDDDSDLCNHHHFQKSRHFYHVDHNPLCSNNSLDKEAQASIEEIVIHKEQKEALRKLISQLPYKQRITLILKIYHKLTFLEIARVVESSIGTVKANGPEEKFYQNFSQI